MISKLVVIKNLSGLFIFFGFGSKVVGGSVSTYEPIRSSVVALLSALLLVALLLVALLLVALLSALLLIALLSALLLVALSIHLRSSMV
jgi:hypothetical protein